MAGSKSSPITSTRSTRPSGMRSRFAVSVTTSLRARVAQPVLDALVPVEHGHRQQDRAALVGAEEDRGGLRQRRQQRGHAVAALDADRLEHVREPVRELLELPERHAPLVALPVLPDHREAVGLVLVADVARDVVALRHLPAVRGAHLLVAAELVLAQAHRVEASHALELRSQERSKGGPAWTCTQFAGASCWANAEELEAAAERSTEVGDEPDSACAGSGATCSRRTTAGSAPTASTRPRARSHPRARRGRRLRALTRSTRSWTL